MQRLVEMKKFLNPLLITVIAIIGCQNSYHKKDELYIEKSLDSVISNYITDHLNSNIYAIMFYHVANKQYVEISSSYDYYNKDFVDGCFMKNGKIIVYCSFNNGFADSLMYIPKSVQCMDSLKSYRTSIGCRDVDFKTKFYRIINKSQIVAVKPEEIKYESVASDTNVIKRRDLNDIVNNYINEINPLLTYIRFKHIKNKRYFSIGSDNVYERKGLVGVFFRNGRLVVLYSDNGHIDDDIAEKSELGDMGLLDGYRVLPREFPLDPRQEEYQIHLNKITKLNKKNPVWINVYFFY